MNAVATRNDWHAPPVVPADGVATVDKPRGDVIDVSRPLSVGRFWKPILEWIKAVALVLAAVLALIGVGIPVVLVVRSIVTALSWVIDRF